LEKGELAMDASSIAALDVSFDDVPAWKNGLEEDRILLFDPESDAEVMSAFTVKFMRERGLTWLINLPLYVRERPAWVIAVLGRDRSQLTERNLELFKLLSRQLTLALELRQLSDEARGEAEQSAVLNERNRIAREIHDTLAQSFTGIVVQLEAGKRALPDEPDETEAHLERASSLAREGLQEARRSVQALRPLALEQADLPTTLEQFLDRMTGGTPTKCDFKLTGTPAVFAPEITANFLRVGQEAVTNAVRHAGASVVKVRLDYEPNRMTLSVEDDGCGFDPELTIDGFGLIGMRERARSIGARLDIRSRLSVGTSITVVFEVESTNATSNEKFNGQSVK
jgi:signal transduction histidine kinase